MKKQIVLWSGIGIVFLAAITAGSYVQNIGVKNIKLMYALHATDKTIVLMDQGLNGTVNYLTRAKDPAELVKQKMNKEGWSYTEQEGAGYFFEKDRQRCIVTVRQWNHSYFILSVEKNLVDLAG
ncbi:hypothetical protein VQ056_05350 [Paenibacillus sp. JTLBN-2024]|uniref:hypothetical protein n=1 Tax=Paenibacillus sp. FSL M7-1455 TaxID=2975316 RepID=UPI0030FA1608